MSHACSSCSSVLGHVPSDGLEMMHQTLMFHNWSNKVIWRFLPFHQDPENCSNFSFNQLLHSSSSPQKWFTIFCSISIHQTCVSLNSVPHGMHLMNINKLVLGCSFMMRHHCHHHCHFLSSNSVMSKFLQCNFNCCFQLA